MKESEQGGVDMLSEVVRLREREGKVEGGGGVSNSEGG